MEEHWRSHPSEVAALSPRKPRVIIPSWRENWQHIWWPRLRPLVGLFVLFGGLLVVPLILIALK